MLLGKLRHFCRLKSRNNYRGIPVLGMSTLALLTLSLTSCSGGGGGGDDSEEIDIIEPTGPEFQYVQEARSGHVTARRDSRDLSFELDGVESDTLYFAVDEDHEAGSLSTATFVDTFPWQTQAPDAALVFQNGSEKSTVLVRLSQPRYDSEKKTLRYSATVIDGTDASSLDDFTDGALNFIPDNFTDVNLFIDDSAVVTCSGAMDASLLIGASGADQTLGSIQTGDSVLASSNGGVFSSHEVIFAHFAPTDTSTEMISVRVGDNVLTGSPSQCAVRGDFTVVRLKDIRIGDRLHFSDGSDRTVDLVTEGEFSGPIAAISTNNQAVPGSGQFISANGFVVTEHLWTGAVD
jgi:hypothetical protein